MATKVVPPRGLLRKSDSDVVGGLLIKPGGMAFATQDADEEVFVLIRRSLYTNFGWAFRASFYIVLPIIIFLILTNFGIDLSPNIPNSFFYVLPVAYYSVIFTYMLIKFNDWYYNLVIITNKRLIRYSFNPLSTYRVAEANLDRIEDVSQSTVGFFPSIFNYGDLFIQTAAQRGKFLIKSIPRPTWVRNILVDLANLSRNPEP